MSDSAVSPPAPPAEQPDTAASPPASAPSTWRRVLLWGIGLPLALVLLVAVLASIAITTETGLNTLLGLANRFAPGKLQYDRIDGSLAGPLRIEGFRYEDGPLKVALAQADLDWQPTELFSRHLHIERLHFDGLELHLPPSQEKPPEPQPLTLPEVRLPLEVTVADLQGRNIRIVPAEGEPMQIDAIDLKARMAADGIKIENLAVKSPLAEARLSGQADPTGNYPLQLNLDWQAPLAQYGLFQGQGQVQGELRDKLTLTHRITGPATLELNGEVRQPLTEAAWSAKAKLDIADLKAFAPEVADLAGKPLSAEIDAQGVKARFEGKGQINTVAPQLGPTTVDFTAAGDPSAVNLSELRVNAPDWPLTLTAQGDVQLTQEAMGRFNAKGELDATVPEIGPAKLRFAASGDPKSTIKIDELRLTSPNRPLTLSAQGTLQVPELRFDTTGEWQALTWPLQGIPQVESTQGTFTAVGTAKDYRFELAAEELRGPNVPKGNWTITGQGSDQAVRDLKVTGKLLEGTLEAAGDATWVPAVGWQATLTGQGLNPGAHWQDVPGKLNFQLKTDGGLENGVLRANVLLEELNGVLSGQRVAGKGDVTLQGENLTIRALNVSAGDAHVEANGTLTERWDLAWKLNAPQLKSLVPGLSGSVASTGKLSGSRTQPVVAAQFTVNNLKQGDTQIQRLSGEANVDIGGVSRSRLNVSGNGLLLGGQKWQTLRLEGSGTPASHELKAELNGDPGNFLVALAGSLQTPAMLWQGRIAQLSAKNTVAGHWNLEKPAALRASAKEANLDTACLSSAPTRVCLQGQWRQSGDFSGRVQLSNLNPGQFKQFFPKDVALATTINGEATASGKLGGALQARANVTIAPGRVSLVAQGRPVQINFNGGTVRVDSNGRTATGQAQFDLAQLGQVQANLQVQDPLGVGRMNGRINAQITDLKLVTVFAPQISEISGQVRADVAVGGTFAQPAVRGEIRLVNTALSIPEAGLKLRNVQFSAVSRGQGPFEVSGSAQSDPGQLELSGQIDPFKPHVVLNIVGENFQAIKSTDTQVQISPDLKIEYAPPQTRVEGTVTIPRAFLRPGGQKPGAINASGDAVIVKTRDGETPKTEQGGMAIFADVRLVLGQDVTLETPAFKGKLRGDLQILQTPQLAPRGTGDVQVVAGKYKIYGEEIEIQRGQLLFSSSPLDNPSLELRVVRQERDIISGSEIMAGAQIRGTLKKPKLTFFSTPTMSDPDVLAYLVLGRAPGGSGTEAAMLFKAASALGSGQDGGITKNLTDAFGLDSAELGSTSQGGTSFMLGKYLTPRLYVGYGIGLLNAVNTFFLKYRFTERLMMESATNSIGTGGDFIYTIER